MTKLDMNFKVNKLTDKWEKEFQKIFWPQNNLKMTRVMSNCKIDVIFGLSSLNLCGFDTHIKKLSFDLFDLEFNFVVNFTI